MFPFGHAALLGPGSLSKAYHLPPMVLRVPARSDKDKKKKAGKEAALSIEECLATETQLAENGFPLTVGTDESGGVLPPFVATCPNVGGIALCAMDCEMVSTATGLELGRVSIVANDLRILYDSFVFPTSPVTDYNTRFSGLTEASLAGAPSLETVRSQILQIIGENSVIVGHSLENDLQCLRITHRRIADTALLFPHPRGGNYKRALRDLVLSYFGETIQDGEHCSVQVRANLSFIFEFFIFFLSSS
jgi:RNA exonuclease 1